MHLKEDVSTASSVPENAASVAVQKSPSIPENVASAFLMVAEAVSTEGEDGSSTISQPEKKQKISEYSSSTANYSVEEEHHLQNLLSDDPVGTLTVEALRTYGMVVSDGDKVVGNGTHHGLSALLTAIEHTEGQSIPPEAREGSSESIAMDITTGGPEGKSLTKVPSPGLGRDIGNIYIYYIFLISPPSRRRQAAS